MSDELSLKVKNAIEESVDLKKLVLHQKLYKVLVEMGELVVKSILNGGKELNFLCCSKIDAKSFL